MELALKGRFAPASGVKGRLHRAVSPISAQRLCHADEAQPRPWVGVRVCHLLLLLLHNDPFYSVDVLQTMLFGTIRNSLH